MAKIILSQDLDPWVNLAMEEQLFRQVATGEQMLFLWRNRPSVVIGRCQNPWVECDLELMAQDSVTLARRFSGGGAVYHDLGNSNFTFISGNSGQQFAGRQQMIQRALARFGIQVHIGERHDLWVADRKVSGSAFRRARGRCYYHGTLLIAADLDGLQRYLRSPPKKLRAKGVKSVPSPVANLSDLTPEFTHESFCESLIQEYKAGDGPCQVGPQAPCPEMATTQNWEWLFGQTPPFVHPLDRGEIHVHRGRVKEIAMDGHPRALELQGRRYSPSTIEQALL